MHFSQQSGSSLRAKDNSIETIVAFWFCLFVWFYFLFVESYAIIVKMFTEFVLLLEKLEYVLTLRRVSCDGINFLLYNKLL